MLAEKVSDIFGRRGDKFGLFRHGLLQARKDVANDKHEKLQNSITRTVTGTGLVRLTVFIAVGEGVRYGRGKTIEKGGCSLLKAICQKKKGSPSQV